MIKKGTSVVTLLVLAMVASFIAKLGQTITCQQVDVALSTCMSYLTECSAEPSIACYSGALSIKHSIPTKTDRQMAYQCVKDVATKILSLKDDAAQ
ncbi:Lipid transfer protein/Par allergen [Parasponia andersonii]|uniref:Lipid transfer protein/Par allergen n=1 Tax=Parasponia andersonii TaxID=3476 RepID=A0A2P5C5X9_PARAD|nr:Lipid transfer protein/Par allergen [Parasponia andersonii]